MDFSAILNLVIGLIFIYFLLALACSTIHELLAQLFDMRAKNLESWLKSAFKENGLGEKFLEHRLIDGLTKEGRKASYIPTKVFSGVLLDLVNETDSPYTFESIQESIKSSDLPKDLKRQLLQTSSEAKNGLTDLRSGIEGWFDDCMKRIGGTYKKNTQKFLFFISIIVVTLFNIDSLKIIKYLYDHPAETAALADRISENIHDLDPDSIYASEDSLAKGKLPKELEEGIKELKIIEKKMEEAKIPFGWSEDSGNTSGSDIMNKFLGLFLSIIAGIIGAPFWFDVLNKLVNLRSAGSKPEESSKPNSQPAAS